MSPDKLEILVNNDREWRVHILSKLDSLEKSQYEHGIFINTLKIKMATYSTIFGFVGSILYTVIIKTIGNK